MIVMKLILNSFEKEKFVFGGFEGSKQKNFSN